MRGLELANIISKFPLDCARCPINEATPLTVHATSQNSQLSLERSPPVSPSRACGKAAGQETYVILLRARHALEKPSRFSRASGSGTLSASNIQVQSKPCLGACVSPTPTARLLPVLVELRVIVAPPESSGLGSRPWTRCPRDGGVWSPRLPFARAQSLFDHQGVTGGVNMRHNPHRFVRREGSSAPK